LYCQSPLRVIERGGYRRREAEFGDVIRLTVLYGRTASVDRSSWSVVPCGSQGTLTTLWSPGVKPAAPMKTETTSEFVGQQFIDMVNDLVSPFASGTPHESQFDRLPVKFAKSNVFPYGAEPKFEVELKLDHLPEPSATKSRSKSG